MKKFLIILSLIILTSGCCSVVRIDTRDIDNISGVVLSKDNKLYNRIGKGYKYYKPRGVSYIDTDELNDVLYSNGNFYYLYIDAVSYYYKKSINHNKSENAYYYKEITGDKEGYIEINKNGKKYHVEFVYNYTKIEALVSKKDINKVILDASYILSTVKFNDNIIALMLNDEYFTNKEEQYLEFKTKVKEQEKSKNFLQYDETEEN